MLLCLLAFLPLTGCEALPFARELEATMLVQVLGVDWDRRRCDPYSGQRSGRRRRGR